MLGRMKICRNRPRPVFVALVLGLLSAPVGGCGVALAEGPGAVERPYPGLTYRHEVRKDPRPQRLYWATVDLADPKVSLRVAPGGADPDGSGKWQTTLMRPTAIARREAFELTVNGDFFDIQKAPAPANPQPAPTAENPNATPAYTPDTWAVVMGPAATDGRAWNWRLDAQPCLVVKKSGAVSIEMLARPRPDDAQVISGNTMLVQDGKPVPNPNTARHPRTVVGLDAAGKRLTILVVDGRRPTVADGMTYAELAAELIAAGCDRGFNLDGGGSTVMVIRSGDRYEIKNSPSGFFERPVANVLGVDVKDAK